MKNASPVPADAPGLTPNRERWLLLSLAGVQFTHILDFMIMMPLGPQFTRLLGISEAQFGMLVSAYTLAAGASGLLATLFIDRFERKRLLLGLYAGFAVATLGCGLAPGYLALLAARIVAGLFGGVLSALVQTMVADAVPFERRGRATGVMMASFSVSTVIGVPFSLWLADRLGWQAPFLAIALMSAAIAAAAAAVLPRFDAHLHTAGRPSALAGLRQVVRDPNHWRAFALSALMLSAGFAIIPYLTIYLTANVGLTASQVPLMYLAGGFATLFTARLWGILADRFGKVRTFRLIALAAMVPMLLVTHLPASPLWAVLTVTTIFFIFVSGRMVPGMAIITSAAQPAVRGAFMSLNAALQSGAMGVAAWIGGLLIGRTADGSLAGFNATGWVGVAVSLCTVWLVGRLHLHTAPPARASSAPAENI
ncbi:MFS transporter [Aquabacterium sp. A7-Y]|uniref:MFS transporter n=1 Tax=Aquabacterium sp. A7-Y TaxID=1349605 RepID=UPI00223DCDC0|nr:MFS transporter [Aquabacterium sp. A7-Y]MCW7536630.1 MFS transporter [Aquabacterium sp. A7-Y]